MFVRKYGAFDTQEFMRSRTIAVGKVSGRHIAVQSAEDTVLRKLKQEEQQVEYFRTCGDGLRVPDRFPLSGVEFAAFEREVHCDGPAASRVAVGHESRAGN